MKKLIKSLPALGLALAASMAFAFNMPQQNDDPVYADHPIEGPIEISDWEMGTDYLCSQGDQCTYNANGQTLVPGTFVPLR